MGPVIRVFKTARTKNGTNQKSTNQKGHESKRALLDPTVLNLDEMFPTPMV
jgi:hypothetical protein